MVTVLCNILQERQKTGTFCQNGIHTRIAWETDQREHLVVVVAKTGYFIVLWKVKYNF